MFPAAIMELIQQVHSKFSAGTYTGQLTRLETAHHRFNISEPSGNVIVDDMLPMIAGNRRAKSPLLLPD